MEEMAHVGDGKMRRKYLPITPDNAALPGPMAAATQGAMSCSSQGKKEGKKGEKGRKTDAIMAGSWWRMRLPLKPSFNFPIHTAVETLPIIPSTTSISRQPPRLPHAC
jgi:hypothetical protein